MEFISWDRTFKCFIFFLTKKMTIKEFKIRLWTTKWYSQKTIDNYTRTLQKFDDYLKDISLNKRWVEQCELIKIHDIEQFIFERKLKWIDTRTLNNYLSWIKTYITFCAIHWKKVLDWRQIVFAKEHKKKIDSLSEEECEKLIHYFKHIKTFSKIAELIKIRNLLIISMLLYTWLRISELSWIKIKDISEHMQVIWKWWERRTIMIMDEEMKLIKLYLFMRKDDSERLFINHSRNYLWKKLSNVSIEKIVREWWIKAWLKKEIFPHMLRHTFATLLLRNQANIYHIQQLLWHKNLNTTQTYLTVLNYELENTQKKIPRFW